MKIRALLACGALGVVSVACGKAPARPQTESAKPDPKAKHVLLAGNSYFGTDTPQMLKQLAASGKKSLDLDANVVYGSNLRALYRQGATERMVKAKRYDWVVLQCGMTDIAYHGTKNPYFERRGVAGTYEALKNFDQVIRPTGARTAFFLPWGYGDGMNWFPGMSDDFESMSEKIVANGEKWAAELDVSITPVGVAFLDVWRRKKDVTFLIGPDQHHPTRQGHYLSACVLYASIFLASPEGLWHPDFIGEDDARMMQVAAADAVLKQKEKWRLAPKPDVAGSEGKK